MSIEVKNLLKVYNGQKAVNNISFKAGRGEIVGFLGPNGAGKSTTMKIITGYLPASAGQAWVCGFDVAEEPLQIKKKIGYLPEQNALYYDMFVREYLGFIAEVHGIPGPRKRIEDIIELTGLKPESKKKIGQLSKGYKQRVGLAAALIHDPEVLILDEPTSGLDPNQIIEIREVIKNQGKTKTVLFSTHILQEVEAICDRVIIINKGELVADDSLSNLQKAGSQGGMVKLQLKESVDPGELEKIGGIGTVTARGNSFQIRTNDPEATKKKLLSWAVEKNLNIVSLQSGGQKLEDVFRSLTESTG